jgi:hypothetical protein
MTPQLAHFLVFMFGVVVGSCTCLAFEAFHREGERRRFTAELSPVWEALDYLEEKLDHYRKRMAKRARDEGRDLPFDSNAPRESRLMALKERVRRGRGLSQETEEVPHEGTAR